MAVHEVFLVQSHGTEVDMISTYCTSSQTGQTDVVKDGYIRRKLVVHNLSLDIGHVDVDTVIQE